MHFFENDVVKKIFELCDADATDITVAVPPLPISAWWQIGFETGLLNIDTTTHIHKKRKEKKKKKHTRILRFSAYALAIFTEYKAVLPLWGVSWK